MPAGTLQDTGASMLSPFEVTASVPVVDVVPDEGSRTKLKPWPSNWLPVWSTASVVSASTTLSERTEVPAAVMFTLKAGAPSSVSSVPLLALVSETVYVAVEPDCATVVQVAATVGPEPEDDPDAGARGPVVWPSVLVHAGIANIANKAKHGVEILDVNIGHTSRPGERPSARAAPASGGHFS
jgi:hypothetical protein